MGFFNIKKITFGIFVGMIVMLAANSDVSAQSRREVERERQQIERENARYERQRGNRNYRNGNQATRQYQQRGANPSYTMGYDQGFQAGQFDRRSGKYNRSNVYRDTGASPNQGDPSSTDYIYRQGYLQGYNEGFNGIRNY
jgi:hypothetical protein